MRLTIEPTDKLVFVTDQGGAALPRPMQARVWQGEDEHGQELHLYVLRVAVPDAAPLEAHARFAEGLIETAPMRPDVAAIPIRLII